MFSLINYMTSSRSSNNVNNTNNTDTNTGNVNNGNVNNGPVNNVNNEFVILDSGINNNDTELQFIRENIIKDCIIYCRISSDQQSLDAQESECKNYALKYNFNILDVIKETGSARQMKNLKKLTRLINDNRDINIVIYSVDRFCRNTVDAINILPKLEKRNITLISVTDSINLNTASGKHAFRQRVSAAELESDLISERVKRSISFRKRNNCYVGGAQSYGFKTVSSDLMIDDSIRKVKTKVEDLKEQSVIAFICNVMYCNYTSNGFSLELYKVLDIYNLDNIPVFFFEHEIDNETNESKIQTAFITAEMIADVLNDYTIKKRKNYWTISSVKSVYSKYHYLYNQNFNDNDIEMEIDVNLENLHL